MVSGPSAHGWLAELKSNKNDVNERSFNVLKCHIKYKVLSFYWSPSLDIFQLSGQLSVPIVLLFALFIR